MALAWMAQVRSFSKMLGILRLNDTVWPIFPWNTTRPIGQALDEGLEVGSVHRFGTTVPKRDNINSKNILMGYAHTHIL